MKVFVGLSGGVDSAVSAALLRKQGHDVTGVFIKIWQPEFTECTWKEDRLDAMRVAATLGIPFKEIDLSAEYKRHVIDTMVSGYARGITPNPDVMCNQHIKFGSFAQWCFESGAEAIATGHYARTHASSAGYNLLRAADAAKDQSYFLYRIQQDVLAKALFPIGAMTKQQVRKVARELALPVAQKPDSQGLCFAGHISMEEFMSRYLPLTPGPVVMNGTRVGEHRGAALYTIGQRHGLSVMSDGDSVAHYVTKIDVATNTVHVSTDKHDASRARVVVDDVHWINRAPQMPATVAVQSRYHETPVTAEISGNHNRVEVTFSQRHLTSGGQSMVFYNGDTCLGGGDIGGDCV